MCWRYVALSHRVGGARSTRNRNYRTIIKIIAIQRHVGIRRYVHERCRFFACHARAFITMLSVHKYVYVVYKNDVINPHITRGYDGHAAYFLVLHFRSISAADLPEQIGHARVTSGCRRKPRVQVRKRHAAVCNVRPIEVYV